MGWPGMGIGNRVGTPANATTPEQYTQGLTENSLIRRMTARICWCDSCTDFWQQHPGALDIAGALELESGCLDPDPK